MKLLKRSFSFILICALLLQVTAFASTEKNTDAPQFIDFEITNWNYNVPVTRSVGLVHKQFTIGKTDDGKLSIIYATVSSPAAAEIGVKDLRLQRQTWYGTWETIRTTNPVSYNTDTNIGGYYYLNPSSGTTYRVVGTHYAIINGIRYEEFHIGGNFTY